MENKYSNDKHCVYKLNQQFTPNLETHDKDPDKMFRKTLRNETLEFRIKETSNAIKTSKNSQRKWTDMISL